MQNESEIKYHVKRKNRKTVGIVVERDKTVVVIAPENVSEEKISELVKRKKFWILDKLNNSKKYSETENNKEFVSGESLLYLGKNYKLEIIENDIDGIHFENKFIVSKKNSDKANLLIKEWYKLNSKEVIIPKAEFFAKELGVSYSSIKISNMKFRWGSCTPKNNINFSWRLIKAPVNVIEYIIVHELTHLIESNHTAKFWNIVSVQLPYYQKAKEWLKENGSILESDF